MGFAEPVLGLAEGKTRGLNPSYAARDSGARMIKDIALHLSPRAKDGASIDYAISVASAFEAHLAGIAFALDPFIPPTMGIGDTVPADWIDEQKEEAEAAA